MFKLSILDKSIPHMQFGSNNDQFLHVYVGTKEKEQIWDDSIGLFVKI